MKSTIDYLKALTNCLSIVQSEIVFHFSINSYIHKRNGHTFFLYHSFILLSIYVLVCVLKRCNRHTAIDWQIKDESRLGYYDCVISTKIKADLCKSVPRH